MCTAVTYEGVDFYFGRNLDLDVSFNEQVTITPRQFELQFRNEEAFKTHLAMIGMASVVDDYPLYYDAMNEKGLCMAGLNFPGNACYLSRKEGMKNITPFEFIPFILGSCSSVEEAVDVLKSTILINETFNDFLPLAPLHWIISDQKRSIVVEPMPLGLKVFDNPVGVLTNNPTFDYHLTNLNNFLNLTSSPPINRFSGKMDLSASSIGMGSIGLPGDLSSPSRFVRAAFTKANATEETDEGLEVAQFFHILDSVAFTKGCAINEASKEELTIYSACMNTQKGIYYYKTYANNQLNAVYLKRADLDGSILKTYELITSQQIREIN
ncbi:MAG TPA: choloylglycine hydrolase [Trichococcus sp.]|nr:choloylglycine hydrolase [Trichococcus sp.]